MEHIDKTDQPTQDLQTTSAPPEEGKSGYPFLFVLISANIIIVDQLTKLLARYYLIPYQEGKSVIGEFFKLTLVYNDKAAFSLGFGNEKVNFFIFTILPFLIIALIIYMLKISKSRWERLAYSMIIGGAIGNLIDRVLFGKVTDFLDFDWPDWLFFPRWPTFNIADSAIVCAVFILLIYVIFFERKRNE